MDPGIGDRSRDREGNAWCVLAIKTRAVSNNLLVKRYRSDLRHYFRAVDEGSRIEFAADRKSVNIVSAFQLTIEYPSYTDRIPSS